MSTTGQERLPRTERAKPLTVRTSALTKIYGKGQAQVIALDNVDITFTASKFTTVMGPSGSGKSTLLHCAAGLDTPSMGNVYFGDTDISRLSDKQTTALRRDRIGFIFQSYNLVPTLNVRENIELPLMISKRKADQSWFDIVVGVMELTPWLKQMPIELSGGQRQRVAWARALITKPDIIFADEPTGNLDSVSSGEMLEFLRRGVDRLGQTVVQVTHDSFAASFSDQVIFLSDGRVVEELTEPTEEEILSTIASLSEAGMFDEALPRFDGKPAEDERREILNERKQRRDEYAPQNPPKPHAAPPTQRDFDEFFAPPAEDKAREEPRSEPRDTRDASAHTDPRPDSRDLRPDARGTRPDSRDLRPDSRGVRPPVQQTRPDQLRPGPRPDGVRPDQRPDDRRPDTARTDGRPARVAASRRPDLPRPDIQRPDMPRPDIQRQDKPRPDGQRPDMPRPDQQSRPELRPGQSRPDLRPRPDVARPDGRQVRPDAGLEAPKMPPVGQLRRPPLSPQVANPRGQAPGIRPVGIGQPGTGQPGQQARTGQPVGTRQPGMGTGQPGMGTGQPGTGQPGQRRPDFTPRPTTPHKPTSTGQQPAVRPGTPVRPGAVQGTPVQGTPGKPVQPAKPITSPPPATSLPKPATQLAPKPVNPEPAQESAYERYARELKEAREALSNLSKKPQPAVPPMDFSPPRLSQPGLQSRPVPSGKG